MRKIIFIITTLFYKMCFAGSKHVKLLGQLFRVKISGYKNSYIELRDEISNSRIDISGNNNTIVSSGIVQHSQIRIIGSNNKIIFKKGCRLCNSELLIRANNAEFFLGERSNILEGYFICQGESNYIHIGEDCLFAHNVEIWNSDTHKITNLEGEIINKSKPVIIGNHVWLGKYVKVLKGVTIGDNSVVGMNSMVTRDIPANTINAGIPSKTIRTDINWDKDLIII